MNRRQLSGPENARRPSIDATLTKDTTAPADRLYRLAFHQTGETVSFKSNGHETHDENRNGAGFTYGYGTGTWPTTVTSYVNTYTISYDYAGPGGRLSGLTETSGSTSRTVGFGYDTSTRLAQVTDAAGGVTSFGYDTTNRLTQITDPTGVVTTIGYGSGLGNPQPGMSADQVISITRDAGGAAAQTSYGYPTLGEVDVTDADHHPHSAYLNDYAGKPTTVTDPFGLATTTSWTGDFQPASVTDAAGGTSTLTWGANGGESLTQSVDQDGVTITLGYTAGGNAAYEPTSVTDPMGASAYTYDGPGNLSASKVSPDQTDLTHDPASGALIASAEPNNVTGTVSGSATRCGPANTAGNTDNCTSFDLDPTTHQVDTVTPPAGTSLAVVHLTYDPFGRLASQTRAVAGATVTETYGYDDDDRLTSVSFSDGSPDLDYRYDGAGNLTLATDATATTSYYYDTRNHLTAKITTAPGGATRAPNPCPAASDTALCYGYDPVGNLTSAADGGGTTTYDYNKANLLDAMQEPNGAGGTGPLIMFGYNKKHERTDTWDAATGTTATFPPTYSTSGSPWQVDAPTGWVLHLHTGLSKAGRLTALTATTNSGATTVENLGYSYDYTAGTNPCGYGAAGVPAIPTGPTQLRQQATDLLDNTTTTYCYDARKRLVSATGPTTYTYGYDPDGNLTAGPGAHTGYDPANQITDPGWTYDGDGNLTTDPTLTAGYNALDQTTQVTAGTTASPYTYTGQGQTDRATGTDLTGATLTYATGLPGLASQLDATGTGAYFEHTPDGTLVAERTVTNHAQTGEYFYYADGVGSVLGIVNAATGATAATYTATTPTAGTPAPPAPPASTNSATPAPTATPPASTTWGTATTTPPPAASPNPTPPNTPATSPKATPTPTPPTTPSTTPTPPAKTSLAMSSPRLFQQSEPLLPQRRAT